MSLIISECNQEMTVALRGMYDNLSEQEREEKIVKLLTEILRKKAIDKIDEQQNNDRRQQDDENQETA